MIDIGINYLSENEKSYRLLKKYNIVNTLKFPGKVCSYDELECFLKFTKNNELKIDLHGFPKMKPAFSCSNDIVVGKIDFKILEQLFKINSDVYRFSTHVGIDNKEEFSDYPNNQMENNWNENYETLKRNLERILGHNIEIGLENIPGGFDLNVETTGPEFTSKNWRKADFGVFDISHAKLSAKDLGISYDEYLHRLRYTDKVKILHISGDMCNLECYRGKVDKHVLIAEDEINDIIKTLKIFKNLDLVDSEYAYSSLYPSDKEIIIEAITIKTIVDTMNEERSKKVLIYLKENLNDDISNLEEVLNNIF